MLQTFFSSISLSIARIAVAVTLVSTGVVFLWRIPASSDRPEPLLRLSDCFTGLPAKGFILALCAALFSALLMALGVPEYFGDLLMRFDLSDFAGMFWAYAFLALSVTILTEFVSNTTVALTFFPLVYVFSVSLSLDPLAALLLVSLSTTCAFMTPIATPVNALAYGSVKNVSLRKMVLAGLLMNLCSALWLSWATVHIAPLVPVSYTHLTLPTN